MIRDNKWGVSVEKMCNIFGMGRSSYYAWLKRVPDSGSELESKIRTIFYKSKSSYGSPRIVEELRDQHIKTSKSTVARIMNKLRLVAKPKKKFVVTTDSNHDNPISENILNREFYASRVNHKWVSDITYIATRQGWCYLTAILDLADRMVVSWHLSNTLNAEHTIVIAMNKALEKNRIRQKLIFHSDRGIQYSCLVFRHLLNKNKNIQQSMSRKANCWDNAVAESFFKTIKSECIKNQIFEDIYEAKKHLFDYIERWYNTHRKHSSIGFMSPLQKNKLLTNRLDV